MDTMAKAHLARERRLELASEWREQADDLDRRAALNRRAGDPVYAEELEAAALDYRIAAERLELTTGADAPEAA